ncbi:MAG: neuromedin U [Ignavibacteria bacterium]|nr:neuromedin U [Ignavibacteria bacterium]MBT8383900.1 neuromedin U [Ignavibacteria bacterium]MBT8390632.1 neuromedin U [Ignavibacteria bacterium]NNJ51699.1 neuromedin U [Ignavibacteriaceae bacterium]NNL22278.1 neuromedin U [Ignavibacteriaceae bacterium]
MNRFYAATIIFFLQAALVSGFLFISGTILAQDKESKSPKIDFSLPIEIDFDYGASNGYAIINRYLPLVAFPIGEKWKLINLTQIIIADAPGGVPGRPGNPEPGAGDRVFGLSDLTNAVILTPPPPSKRFVWGFGPALVIPIATDERLGSGKWLTGPALRIAYRPGEWNLGALIVNLWSFTGDSNRKEVNQLLIRGLIRRRLGGGWYFTSNPIITANWKAESGQKWLLPLGAGIGRRFEIGSLPVAFAVHYYHHVIKPDGAPEGLFRLDFILPVPAGLQRPKSEK